MNNVTVSQIDKMKHCIGFDTAIVKGMIKGTKHRKYNAFRNYYTTPDNNKDLDYLVEIGFMQKRNFEGVGNSPQMYWVVEKGFEFLKKLLGVTITEMRR